MISIMEQIKEKWETAQMRKRIRRKNGRAREWECTKDYRKTKRVCV